MCNIFLFWTIYVTYSFYNILIKTWHYSHLKLVSLVYVWSFRLWSPLERGQGLIPFSIKGCRSRQISLEFDPARFGLLSFELSKIHCASPRQQNQCRIKFFPNHEPNSMNDGRHPPDLGECQWALLSLWDYSEFSHPSPPSRLQRHHLDTWPGSDDTDQNSSSHQKSFKRGQYSW